MRNVPIVVAVACAIVFAAAVACERSSPEPTQVAPVTQDPTVESPAPTVTATVGLPGPSEVRTETPDTNDLAAIEEVVAWQSQAIGDGNTDAFYDTCHPALSDSARSSGAMEKQLAALPSGFTDTRFVVEDVIFSGTESATVIFGLKWGLVGSLPAFGGGTFEKLDGRWYSLGWGCI